MTGFRLGLDGVQGLENIRPDLTAMGKVIGGGLPVGAFGGRREVMEQLAPLGPVYQAGTLSGNPLAMAAGLASLHLLEREKPYAELNRMGAMIATALKQAAADKGIALQVPQVGSMFSLFFSEQPVTNYEEAIGSQTDLFKRLFHYALNRGVYLPPSPFETCFLCTAHRGCQIEDAADILCAGIAAL